MMRWSDWYTPAEAQLDAWGRFRTFASQYRDPVDPAFDAITYDVDRLDVTPGNVGYQPNVLEATWTDHPGDEPPRTHIQFLLGPNNEPPGVLDLPPLPIELADVLADLSVPWGSFGDIEWEAPEGTHLGWAWGAPATIINRTGAPEAGRVQLVSPSDYFTHGGVGYNLADHPTYPLPSGPSVVSFGGTDPVGTTLGTLPDPGPVFGFAVVIDVDNPGVDASVAVNVGDLYARVQYPRWRVQIPGSKLRQIHRDDGRGITPKRQRGAVARPAERRSTPRRSRAYD